MTTIAHPSEPAPVVLSIKQACRYLHLGEHEVRRLCAGGQLAAFTTRGHGAWRIPVASCEAYIAAQLAAAQAERA